MSKKRLQACHICGQLTEEPIDPEELTEAELEQILLWTGEQLERLGPICSDCFEMFTTTCQECGAFPAEYFPWAKKCLCPDCAFKAEEEYKERTGQEICAMCEEPIKQKVVADWIDEPLCFDCYLKIAGISPWAMVDYCGRCGSCEGVAYYPMVGDSLCRKCGANIPRTGKS